MEQFYLYILLVVTLPTIVVLALALYRCRRRLSRCQEAMVRLINENLDMKEKLPAHEHPNFMNRGDITPEEFTEIIHNMLKRLLFLSLFFLAAVYPSAAQERSDTTYLFRFVPQKDMFYVPWNGNGQELERLLECVENHKTDILDGRMPLYVDGYCNSSGREAANLATAKIRSNRVKSELIVRCGIKEESFVTKNHADGGNFVTVRLTVPAGKTSISDEEEVRSKAGEEPLTDGRAEQEHKAEEVRKVVEKADSLVMEPAANEERQQEYIADTPALESQPSAASRFALRANLLRWATLTPDLGVEWRICPSWSILVNGSWTSWSWNDKDRRYALWEVAPEVRYYIGKEKRGYVGAMYKAGSFNYKFSETGRQGDIMGGGITGGYVLWLNRALNLDFSLGVGCIHADYEKYTVIDNVHVRQVRETRNWWGPTQAGVALVWTIF